MPLVRSLLLVLAFAPSALAQVSLEWKFSEGDSFFVERVYAQKQTVEVKNKPYTQERTATWLTKVTVKDKAAGGHVLDFTIESVAYKTMGALGPDPFDEKLAARMKGIGFKITISPAGKLSKFEGYDAFIQKLSEKNADIDKVLRVLLSEEGLRDGVEELFGFLPPKMVRVGDKWKREGTDAAPPFGSFKTVTEYSLQSSEDDEATIVAKVDLTYRPPGADPELFRVVKGEVKADEGKGLYVFSAKNGRLVRGEKSVHLKGDLVLESMGQQTPLAFTSENTLRIRVFTEAEKK